MMQQSLNGMVTLLLAKFVLNDMPHAVGLYDEGSTMGSLFTHWGISTGDQVTMYHFTRRENLGSIMLSGLSPGRMTGARKTVKGGIEQGIYLSPTVEDSKGILEDYNTQEVRTPGTFSLLEVTLPSSWPVIEDLDVAHRYGEPPTVISKKSIPASMVKLVDENFFTVTPAGTEYREVPGIYPQVGDRVRIKHGEHEGEEGFVTRFADKVEDGFVVWIITLDSGTVIEDREDKVAALYK